MTDMLFGRLSWTLLAALVGIQLVLLARRLRARVFGARLTLRLLARFAALAVVPGLIVYAVSVQFLTRSIESWFDVKVDAALEGGINLGQQVIEQMTLELRGKANVMAADLAEPSPARLATQLEGLRAQLGVEEAVVVTTGGCFAGCARCREARAGASYRPCSAPGARDARLQRGGCRLGPAARVARGGTSGNAGRGALPAAQAKRAGVIGAQR
jgi:nitrogen fixation/metabolism regulation signal transduction histidine kinase